MGGPREVELPIDRMPLWTIFDVLPLNRTLMEFDDIVEEIHVDCALESATRSKSNYQVVVEM